jgi:hypothetical protein
MFRWRDCCIGVPPMFDEYIEHMGKMPMLHKTNSCAPRARIAQRARYIREVL